MASLTILYWRDIPTQVIARSGRQSAKLQLSTRFTEAIDMAAMRSGAIEADIYLADWRRADAGACCEDITQEAHNCAKNLEADYDQARLMRLIEAGGREL